MFQLIHNKLNFEHKIWTIAMEISMVVEMRAKGMSQIEIAHELQVSEASIGSDMQQTLRSRYASFTAIAPVRAKTVVEKE